VPDHAWLVETLFAYDVVGFQTSWDMTNFQRYALEQSGGVLKAGGQTYAFGQTIGGTLEMSNVDLASEFTSMIVAQRGFQANSKVISTSDEMLQELVNLKR